MRYLNFTKISRPALTTTQPPIKRIQGFVPGLKPPERDVDCSNAASANFNGRNYTSDSHSCLHGLDRDKLAVSFTKADIK
jgi:hypothetical protein